MDVAKRAAAYAASREYIRSGCRLGVGTGTTSKFVVEYIKEQIQSGTLTDIKCVPSSYMTRMWLVEAGINVTSFEETPELDVYIDGADEIDNNLNCIKGSAHVAVM